MHWRTWILIGGIGMLVGVIVAIPSLRQNVASWIGALFTALFVSAQEAGRRQRGEASGQETSSEPADPDPPTAEDYKQSTVDPSEHHIEPNQHRPDDDQIDHDYWESLKNDEEDR